MTERKIGSHVSISGGLLGAAKEAASYSANTFMVYTGAPQNTVRKPVSALKVPEGHEFMEKHGISDIVVHAPYIVNMASYKENIYDLAKSFMKTELETAAAFGSNYIVTHPGAYTDKDLEYGISRIVEVLNGLLSDDLPTVCLETMAGKGSEIGGSFEELREIISRVERKDKVGVCVDTCHIHDAGYDIIDNLDGVLEELNSVIGLDFVKVIHLNGSLNDRGARKDRHANLGAESGNPRGADKIGFKAVSDVFWHKSLKDKIFILETPWLDDKTNLYKEEIAALRQAGYGRDK